MDIGIGVPSAGDSWKVVERAEELGFTHAWFYDTQQLCGDVFVAMAAAAMRTERIRLGTGVLIPSNRIASVTANAFATLNGMAPGRIDFGVGTGFTGRRTMGVGAMKLRDMEDHIETVYGMLRGEVVEMDFEGAGRKVSFLNPELGLINLDDPVQLHVSAFGPRSRQLAARLKAAWIDIVFTERTGIRDIERMRAAWDEAGNPADELYATMLTLGRVLDDGEAYDSPLAVAQAGAGAAIFLHSVVESEATSGRRIDLPDWQRELADRYHEVYEAYQPADARYLSLHRGHMMFVRDEEAHLITGDLIREKTFTGTRDELIERMGHLKAAGYSQIAVQYMPGHESMIEDWAPVLQAVRES
ncbi:MAG: LLM class flavin-dependent oxidoreductase [Alphaproteobacteria bacterium]|jgi:5,10-methylenetetrahydromethanopterin reductase|nr:LLM class flavin-dependent oxidoreductase [Alphaproteobacteria bacterium]MDP6814868.1 LLM class flavin-dependent oxidoreductase [Alphaproteobacteria bacterium]